MNVAIADRSRRLAVERQRAQPTPRRPPIDSAEFRQQLIADGVLRPADELHVDWSAQLGLPLFECDEAGFLEAARTILYTASVSVLRDLERRAESLDPRLRWALGVVSRKRAKQQENEGRAPRQDDEPSLARKFARRSRGH